MNKLKLLELFGGIGACSQALEQLGIYFEIVDYVEIDKYAVASFNAIHNTNFKVLFAQIWGIKLSYCNLVIKYFKSLISCNTAHYWSALTLFLLTKNANFHIGCFL